MSHPTHRPLHGALLALGTALLVACTGIAPREDTVRADPAHAALDQGRAHYAAGRYGLAIDSLERELARYPTSLAAMNGLGACYDELGRHDVARRYYMQALALAPDAPKTLGNLGRSFLADGRPVDAVAVLTLAAAAAPDDRWIADTLARARAALPPAATPRASAAIVAQAPIPAAPIPAAPIPAAPIPAAPLPAAPIPAAPIPAVPIPAVPIAAAPIPAAPIPATAGRSLWLSLNWRTAPTMTVWRMPSGSSCACGRRFASFSRIARNQAEGSALAGYLAHAVVASMTILDRMALTGDTLLLIGSRAEGETFPYGYFKEWILEPNTGRFIRA